MSIQTPARLGFRMPAEWEPHDATWMSWPRPNGVSFPGSYDQVIPTFVAMVDALSTSERVCINVHDDAEEKEVRKLLQGISRPDQVRFFAIPTDEPWCRDHGPIFLVRNSPPGVALIDWDYNAWGEKYEPFNRDNAVPREIGAQLGLEVIEGPMVLEGGSVDVNGFGALLTTESCLLNPNRNPSLSRGQIEQNLREYLGAHNIIWLKGGVEGDDTDGHIDDIARFISRTTVVTMIEEDKTDPNYEPLRENLMILQDTKIDGGSPLSVLPLPMPKRIDREDLRLPASYANFYIGNSVILLPVFADPNDEKAEALLRKAFPDRRVLLIDCRELIWGLGAFHCLTQQQPAMPKNIDFPQVSR